MGGEDARCGRYGILNRGMPWGDQPGGYGSPNPNATQLNKQFSPSNSPLSQEGGGEHASREEHV